MFKQVTYIAKGIFFLLCERRQSLCSNATLAITLQTGGCIFFSMAVKEQNNSHLDERACATTDFSFK